MRLMNISSNRRAFKPEIAISQPLGNWFADASACAWFFTGNSEFFQVHAGYNLPPGFWLTGDATYYMGGETSLDGVANNDRQSVTRVGVALSVPMGDEFSAKLAGATWLIARNGGTFDTVALTFQYRWF